MDLDSHIFRIIYNFFSYLKSASARQSFIHLYNPSPDLNKLSLFATLASGSKRVILTHGQQNFAIRNHRLMIPDTVMRYGDPKLNYNFTLFKIILICSAGKNGFKNKASSIPAEYSNFIQEFLHTLQKFNTNEFSPESLSSFIPENVQYALGEFLQEFPEFKKSLITLFKEEWEKNRAEGARNPDFSVFWDYKTITENESEYASSPNDSILEESTGQSEIKLDPEEEITVHTVDKKAQQDYTLSHNFEKIETAEEFQGIWRDFDGKDELEDHGEALKELKMKDMIRSNERTHAVIKTDSFRNLLTGFSSKINYKNEFSISYDEWDYTKNSYRKDHCMVFPSHAGIADPVYPDEILSRNRPVISHIRKKIRLVFNKNEQVRRMLSGDEPDIEALVENFSDKKAGISPDERVYLSKRKLKREISLLILADISLSSDSYFSGKRILDMEKESIVIFGEILSENNERFQIDCFSSLTRNRLDYLTVKNFNENWNEKKKYVGGLAPQGYTRIGPALRHAVSQLKKESARQKWILLITDARPNDYDRYEGNYGVNDIGMAVKEAKNNGIHVHSMIANTSSNPFLPVMFGKDGYRLLSKIENLPFFLADFYTRMARYY